jgi:hypothetical protein
MPACLDRLDCGSWSPVSSVWSGVAASFLAFHLYPKGSLGQRFESRESVTVPLSEGVPQMIWVRQGDHGFATVTCEVDAPVDVMTERVLPEYGIDELTDDDGVRWRGQAVVEVGTTGTYEVTCPTDNREGAALSTGDPPRFRGIPERYVAPALPVVPGVLGGALALVIGALTPNAAYLSVGSRCQLAHIGGAKRRRRLGVALLRPRCRRCLTHLGP